MFVLPRDKKCAPRKVQVGDGRVRSTSGDNVAFYASVGRNVFSMLLRLMLAVGVSGAHPEQLLLVTNTLIPAGRGERERAKKVKSQDHTGGVSARGEGEALRGPIPPPRPSMIFNSVYVNINH